MKGVVLAGGTGSRLIPLTSAGVNKHLLPVGKQPMIFWPIQKLVDASITDIMVITGKEHAGSVINCLGSGKALDCQLTYRVQDQSGGIAEALGLARGFSYGERLCVILGDNIFSDPLNSYIEEYNLQNRGARVILKKVLDPNRFGVPELGVDDKILRIEEKPENPKSEYAVTGIYMYDQRVFEIIDKLEPSDRGELEITDVNNTYISWGDLKYSVFSGWWCDCGTHESLQKANSLVKDM